MDLVTPRPKRVHHVRSTRNTLDGSLYGDIPLRCHLRENMSGDHFETEIIQDCSLMGTKSKKSHQY